MNLENISQTVSVWLVAFGLKVLGAIAPQGSTVVGQVFIVNRD